MMRTACSWQSQVMRKVLLVALLAPFAGCATVKPYERERLAQRDMQFDREGDARAGEDHAVNYREGANGATGASGGGCGCN